MQIIIGLLGLSIIIFIHELGHFVTAKWFKVHVIEFAIGMGPKIFSHMHNDTIYSIRLLPLGGFCKMKSENNLPKNLNAPIASTEGTLFMLPTYKKALVILAGAIANILWYIVLSFILFASGYEMKELPSSIDPIANSPAQYATLQTGDTITSINNIPIDHFGTLAQIAQQYAGTEVSIQYKRNNTTLTTKAQLNNKAPYLGVNPFIAPVVLSVKKRNATPVFKSGDIIKRIGTIDINNAIHIQTAVNNYEVGSPVTVTVDRNGSLIPLTVFAPKGNFIDAFGLEFYSVWVKQWDTVNEFIKSRVQQTILMITSTFGIIKNLIIPNKKKYDAEVVGPVRIISIVGNHTMLTARKQGIVRALLQFINISAILSFAVALMNLLPIPVLDGGQLWFYVLHAVMRRRPTYKTLHIFNIIGIIIMLSLFILVMFKDIAFIIGN